MTENTTQATCPTLPASAIDLAEKHLRDILSLAIEHNASHQALIIADSRCALALALSTAYQRCLPTARLIDFDAVSSAEIHAAFATLNPADLVVLVQSSNFRLDDYRLRVELFKRGLKVIEHVHLLRLLGNEALYYIDGLAYDPAYFRGIGYALKARIDVAQRVVIDSDGELLVFGLDADLGGNLGGNLGAILEPAKLNVGDYGNMTNVGGQFPIGEVFTEARDLESVNGRVRIFVFGDTTFHVNKPAQPITLVIAHGRVIETINSTPEFEQVLANIRAVEGEVWLRELGFGLNRAFSSTKTVSDIGTYERMCGIHLSLGAKHGSYSKPQLKRKDARFHIDVFAVTHRVTIDDTVVFKDGAWLNE